LVKQRSPGLDIIRTIAIILVMTTHSITLSGVIDRNIGTSGLFPVLLLRFTAMACVPLFIMLTGYLASGKKLTVKYYVGIIPVLLSYFVISLICMAGKMWVYNEYASVWDAILSMFNFTANTYAWYVEMYIGLFLLIPFLNILWRGIQDIRGRAALIFILAFLTTLPSLFESFIVCGKYFDVIPDYWEAIYPITYYYMGVFISEYKPSLKNIVKNTALRTAVGIVSIVAAAFVPAFVCYTYSVDGYAWYVMNGFACITNALTALMIFLCFYDIDCPKWTSAVFKEISVCTFEMYLFSAIFDNVVYSEFSLPMPFMLAAVFIFSYISARILRLVSVPVSKKLVALISRER